MFGGNFHLGSETGGKNVLKSWIFAHKNMVCGFCKQKTRKNHNVPPNIASFPAIFLINTRKMRQNQSKIDVNFIFLLVKI